MKSYLRTILLSSGMLAVVIYLLHILIGGFLWKGYCHLQQPISDLTATSAPNSGLMQLLTGIYGVLALLFALAFTFFESKKHQKMVFIGGIFFIMLHVISISYNFFPQDLTGSSATFAGTMHIIVTALIVPFTILTPILIGFGFIKNSKWKSFGKYSILTGILILILGGITAVFFMNKLPYFGLVERLNIGVLQIWTFCFSYKLSFKI
ncbi:MAG: DUF998 domain-containing protein [Bacteroidales bacterium]|nr:DUF998 domain-containing protein [Bacteroidales bacterium]